MEQDRISTILWKTLDTDPSWDVRDAFASELQSLMPKVYTTKHKSVVETIARFHRAYEIHQQELRNQVDEC